MRGNSVGVCLSVCTTCLRVVCVCVGECVGEFVCVGKKGRVRAANNECVCAR